MWIYGFAADMLVVALFPIAWYAHWINGLLWQIQVKVSYIAYFYSILMWLKELYSGSNTGAIANEMGAFKRYEAVVSRQIDEFMFERCNIM